MLANIIIAFAFAGCWLFIAAVAVLTWMLFRVSEG
jgi:hypothetical protein